VGQAVRRAVGDDPATDEELQDLGEVLQAPGASAALITLPPGACLSVTAWKALQHAAIAAEHALLSGQHGSAQRAVQKRNVSAGRGSFSTAV
jgi:hypothetical protein